MIPRLRRFAAVLIGLVAAGLPIAVRAQTPGGQGCSIEARVDRATVYQGESVRVQVDVTAPSIDEMADYQPPAFEGFEVVRSGQSQSSSFSFSLGQERSASTTVSYTYLLMPTGGDRLSIGPASFRGCGRVNRSRPLLVRNIGGGGGGAALEGSQQDGPEAAGPAGEPPRDVAVEARVTPREVYPGEQITVEFMLQTRYSISDLGVVSQPSFPDFWKEDLETPQQLSLQTTLVRGQQVASGVLRRYALFATRPGSFTIDPLKIRVETGGGFFQPGREFVRQSQPVTVVVRPFPEQGRPTGFDGANVGRLAFEVTVEPPATTVGNPVTVTLSVTGAGNINSLTLPVLPEIAGARTYPPTPDRRIELEGGTVVTGEKRAEYLVMPLAAGGLVIPPLTFVSFDPGSREYRTLISREWRIPVGAPAGSAPADEMAGSPAAGSVIRAEKRMHPVRFHARLEPAGPPFHAGGLFRMLLVGPPLLYGLLWLGQVAVGLWRALRLRASSRIERRVAARLAAARRLGGGGQTSEALREIHAALLEAAGQSAGTSVRGSGSDETARCLRAAGVAGEAVDRFVGLLERVAAGRFSGAAGVADIRAILEEAAGVIASLRRGRG